MFPPLPSVVGPEAARPPPPPPPPLGEKSINYSKGCFLDKGGTRSGNSPPTHTPKFSPFSKLVSLSFISYYSERKADGAVCVWSEDNLVTWFSHLYLGSGESNSCPQTCTAAAFNPLSHLAGPILLNFPGGVVISSESFSDFQLSTVLVSLHLALLSYLVSYRSW